jgi:hypothetical protein
LSFPYILRFFISKGYVSYFRVMILPSFWWPDSKLWYSFLWFYFQTNLHTSMEVSVLYFIVSMLSLCRLTWSPLISKWFCCTFLMAYSKAKLNSNSDKIFWTILDMKIIREIFAYTDFVTCFTHFNSLTSFMGTPNSMRKLYNTSVLNQSNVFLKSMNSWCTVSLYSQFFSSIRRKQKSVMSKPMLIFHIIFIYIWA